MTAEVIRLGRQCVACDADKRAEVRSRMPAAIQAGMCEKHARFLDNLVENFRNNS